MFKCPVCTCVELKWVEIEMSDIDGAELITSEYMLCKSCNASIYKWKTY